MVTIEKIKKILKEYPTLNYFGFGLYEESYRLREKIITKDEHDKELEKDKQQLLKSIHQINYVMAWLHDVEKTKSINKRRTSYGCKEMIEKTAPGGYISNGGFIVVHLLAGFKMEIYGRYGCFNMSEKALKQKDQKG